MKSMRGREGAMSSRVRKRKFGSFVSDGEAAVPRRGEDGGDRLRVVEGRPEQRAENDGPRAVESGDVPVRMKVERVRAARDGPARPVLADEHRRHRRLMPFRPHDERRVHARVKERVLNQIARVVPSERAQDGCPHAELRGRHGFVHRLAADVQRAGFGPVAGGRDRLRVEAFDDGVDEGHAGADDVAGLFHGDLLLIRLYAI